jgi:hypothetical protein
LSVDPTTAIIRTKSSENSQKLIDSLKDEKFGGSETNCALAIMSKEDEEQYFFQVIEKNKKNIGKMGKKGGAYKRKNNDRNTKSKKQKTE